MKSALRTARVRGLTTTEVRRGRGGGAASDRDATYKIEFASQLKLKIVAHDDQADAQANMRRSS